jgi:succinate dehydrogenase / fumarate reductase cytochrome b subunit
MNRLLRLFGTTIGRKLVVAITGILLVGFVVVHMLGNLAIYQGPEALNTYAAWLQGHPLKWAGRIALLGVFGVHLVTAIALALHNRGARPVGYQRTEIVAAGFASRQIVLTGLLVLAFVVYHLLHFTLGAVQPEHAHLIDAGNRHDVYSMIVHGFQNPIVSASYIVAMLVLGFHLQHGAASLFQTLGVNHETYNAMIRGGSLSLVAIIVIGNCSIPVLVLAGVISPVSQVSPLGGP